MNSASVAAIVPAHDEAATIGEVVRALKACPLISEVVAVDDGSTDGTAEAARAAGADQVIRLARNIGKGGALAVAAAATRADVLFFCDADFIGFRPTHAEAIIRPVLEGRLAMCVGLRDRGALVTAALRTLPFIGGERAMRREVFEAVPERFRRGFGIEAALNYACRANGWRYGGIPSLGVTQRRKIQKVGLIRGVVGYMGMSLEVAAAMIAVRLRRKAFLHP